MTTHATAKENCTFTFESSEGHTVTVVVSKRDKHHAMVIENYHGALAFDVVTTEEARALFPEAYIVDGEEVDSEERKDEIEQYHICEDHCTWHPWPCGFPDF